MKLEIFKDGKLFMTVHSPDAEPEDFIALPKRFVRHSILSPQSFEDLFFQCNKTAKSYVEAYEKAEEIHEKYFERRRYANYDSFHKCMRCL